MNGSGKYIYLSASEDLLSYAYYLFNQILSLGRWLAVISQTKNFSTLAYLGQVRSIILSQFLIFSFYRTKTLQVLIKLVRLPIFTSNRSCNRKHPGAFSFFNLVLTICTAVRRQFQQISDTSSTQPSFDFERRFDSRIHNRFFNYAPIRL